MESISTYPYIKLKAWENFSWFFLSLLIIIKLSI